MLRNERALKARLIPVMNRTLSASVLRSGVS